MLLLSLGKPSVRIESSSSPCSNSIMATLQSPSPSGIPSFHPRKKYKQHLQHGSFCNSTTHLFCTIIINITAFPQRTHSDALSFSTPLLPHTSSPQNPLLWRPLKPPKLNASSFSADYKCPYRSRLKQLPPSKDGTAIPERRFQHGGGGERKAWRKGCQRTSGSLSPALLPKQTTRISSRWKLWTSAFKGEPSFHLYTPHSISILFPFSVLYFRSFGVFLFHFFSFFFFSFPFHVHLYRIARTNKCWFVAYRSVYPNLTRSFAYRGIDPEPPDWRSKLVVLSLPIGLVGFR
ncbi:hypothetical protein BC829DRAFT_171088 [Chytridium lagenaria]|nr:hypothetical protein BC829DRAFT_171088 [Chytridium lagenaria]